MRPGTETYNLKWKQIEEFESDGVKFLRLWVIGKTGNIELIARHNVRRYLSRIKSRFEETKDDDYVFRLRSGKRSLCLDTHPKYLGKFRNGWLLY